jgi:hypothetical protein
MNILLIKGKPVSRDGTNKMALQLVTYKIMHAVSSVHYVHINKSKLAFII